MTIVNKKALKEALKLLDMEITTCKHVIASCVPGGLKKYGQKRLNTLVHIRTWLNVHL